MNTEHLLNNVQTSLTRIMIERSLPSGGLPIAFRALLLSLGDTTIMQEEPFKTAVGTAVVGDTMSKYYVAGERPLGNDLASMSSEPFPLITSHAGTDISMSAVQKLTSFKNKRTGSTTNLRYMVIQFSKLGYEYMKYMKFFPKTYSMTNNKLIPINIKSHVPAELFRTTLFRTLGKGTNMYPLNPSEVFYTMYQLMEEGGDIPVAQLKYFKGFDLGNELNTIYMKPESLVSLFDIGISTFVERIKVEIDLSEGKVSFKSHPYRFLGDVFVNNVQKKIKRSNYTIGHTYFDPETPPISGGSAESFLEYRNVRFMSNDTEELRIELEAALSKELFVEYHHYAQESEIEIEDRIEKGLRLTSKSVRETMLDCINNFREIKRLEYQTEIDKLEEELKVSISMEKVTRPYLRKVIQSLLIEPDDVRETELKRFADEKHKENPDECPDITMEEIRTYVWASGNNILADMNVSRNYVFRAKIDEQLFRLNQIKEKAKDENVENEIKQTYYNLSLVEDFKRKSSVEFLNDSLDIQSRDLLIEAGDLLGQARNMLPHKTHYYANYPLTTTLGENITKDYKPLYTIRQPWIAYQSEDYIDFVYAENLPGLTDRNIYFNTSPAQFVVPANRYGLYLTAQGYMGIWANPDAGGYNSLDLLPKDYVKDFIDIQDMVNWETRKVIEDKQVVMLKNRGMLIMSLQSLLDVHFDRGGLIYEPSRTFQEVNSMEIISNENELDSMYVFSYYPRTYVRLSFLKDKFRLEESFYTNNIVSGYKKAYLEGVHIPPKILNYIADTDIREDVDKINYEYPRGLDKFVTILKDEIEENSEQDLNQIKSRMYEMIDIYNQTGEVEEKYYFKLFPFTFVREI